MNISIVMMITIGTTIVPLPKHEKQKLLLSEQGYNCGLQGNMSTNNQN